MRDYAELIKALRYYGAFEQHAKEAADAIEELLAEVEHWKLEAAANETDRKYLIDENRKLVNSLMNFRVPTWISVEERLPDTYEWVLVHGRESLIPAEAYFDGKTFVDGILCEIPVSHWMPLPESPEEVE